jgi:hypothetical protein
VDTGDPVGADAEPEPDLHRFDPETGEAKLCFSDASGPHEPERSADGYAIVVQRSGTPGVPPIFALEDGMARKVDPTAGRSGGPGVVAGWFADRVRVR